MARLLLLLCVLFTILPISPAMSQDREEGEYEPYEDDEFPRWMHLARRAEVVFLGSFPITMLLSSLTYEGVRFSYEVIARTPGIERSSFGNFSTDERIGLMISGLSLSAIITIIDLVIELRQ